MAYSSELHRRVVRNEQMSSFPLLALRAAPAKMFLSALRLLYQLRSMQAVNLIFSRTLGRLSHNACAVTFIHLSYYLASHMEDVAVQAWNETAPVLEPRWDGSGTAPI